MFVCGSALLQPVRSVCGTSERFFVGVCYHGPDARDYEVTLLFKCAEEATNLNCPLLIIGDYLQDINWSDLKVDPSDTTFYCVISMQCMQSA